MKINVKQLKKLIVEELEEVGAMALPPHLSVSSDDEEDDDDDDDDMDDGADDGEWCDCCETDDCTCDCEYCGSEDDDLIDGESMVDDGGFAEMGAGSEMPHTMGGLHDEMEDSDEDHHSQEVNMVKSGLMNLSDSATQLCELIDFDEELPAWVQSKVAVAVDHINAVLRYMAYKHHGG